jgi:hypothetical protein
MRPAGRVPRAKCLPPAASRLRSVVFMRRVDRSVPLFKALITPMTHMRRRSAAPTEEDICTCLDCRSAVVEPEQRVSRQSGSAMCGMVAYSFPSRRAEISRVVSCESCEPYMPPMSSIRGNRRMGGRRPYRGVGSIAEVREKLLHRTSGIGPISRDPGHCV